MKKRGGEGGEGIRRVVLRRYRDAVLRGGTSAGGATCGGEVCCGPPASVRDLSTAVGYSVEDLKQVPEGANLGLGCGNPSAIAELKSGEVVLDLGAGAGFDCFLAARKVGPEGMVIGVDMTPEMVAKARENAAKGGFHNVSFRLGEIEALPVPDSSVDVILSNCVINLSADKEAVCREAYRVLRPGGRLAISDVVATAPLPDDLRDDPNLWASCIAGAISVEEFHRVLTEVGFHEVRIEVDESSRGFIRQWIPGHGLENYVAAARIRAVKPSTEGKRE